MKYIKLFESYGKETLIVVDVQKSFKEYFTDNYLNALNKYCNNFSNVYQIWDNHHQGKNVDKDYLYDEDPVIPMDKDLYTFPNQKDLIEKRYNYDVDADFYKKILDEDVYKTVKFKELNNTLKKGDFFHTNEGTIIVYIGNNHKWHHMSKKLYDLFLTLKGKEVIIVGGSNNECLLDIVVCGMAMGVKVIKNNKYIYSASNCPIK